MSSMDTGATEPRPVGYLLDDLGYLPEPEAAAAIGVTEPTMISYRKNGRAPEHVELGRRIFYSKEAIAAWLCQGGTRGAELAPVVTSRLGPKPRKRRQISGG